jgi:serine/threonine-protein kinase RsbT
MAISRTEKLSVQTPEDIVQARQLVRAWAVEGRFSLVDQTKLVTATSELARNMVVYAGGGTVRLESVVDGARTGLRVTFEDHGPGIPDIDLALKDGYTSGSGLGLGLGGARRLVNDFAIESRPGEGTIVRIARWR